MQKIFTKLLCTSILCLPSILTAQESFRDSTTLKEVVVSENRLQIPFSKTARNIQIVTKEDIQRLSVKSIQEVLSFVGGIDIRQRGPFGTQADIGIDGGSFDQTLILLNGVKISDVQTGHHSLNIPVPLDAVERIEILKGPAARIYGVNALTGAVNIITKNQETNSFSLHTMIASPLTKKEDGDGGGIYAGGSMQLLANVGNQRFQNLLAYSQDLTNGQRYNTAAKNRRAFYQANWNLNESNSITWMAGSIYNTFGANAYYAAPYDKEAQESVNSTLVNIGSSHRIGQRFLLKPRISYRYNEDDFRLYRNDLSKGRSEHNTDVFAAELNSTLSTGMGDFGFGVESRSEKIESTNMGDHHRYNHGAYLEYKTEAISNVLLNVGTYINYNTQYRWQVFPGLDVAYLFHPSWKLAFNVGSSQRIPTFTDLYLNQRPGNIGNPLLKSENAWQYEGSVQYKERNLTVQAGYFYRDISNFIDWVKDSNVQGSPFQSQNFGQNKVRGLNISAMQQFRINEASSLSYQASYNHLIPTKMIYTNGVTSKYVLENLKHQAILRLAYQYQDWQLSTGNRWVQRELNKGYFISDLRISHIHKGLRMYADVTNIFDQSYVETGAVPLPGRWFALGMSYSLSL